MINNIGKVIKLFISLDGTSHRSNKENLIVDRNGINIDKFYKKDINRSILLTSIKAYEMMKNDGIDTKDGMLGENILVDFNPYDLNIADKIKIGSAILEVTQHCTLCKSLKKIKDCVPKLLKNDRGVFAKVIQSGVIFEGDKITKLS